MSNRENPEFVEDFATTLEFQKSGFLNSASLGNNTDVYEIQMPGVAIAVSSENKINPFGYYLGNVFNGGVNGVRVSPGPGLFVSFGIDGGDGSFPNLKFEASEETTEGLSGLISAEGVLDTSKSLEDNIVNFNTSYFIEILNIENQQVPYELNVEAEPIFKGSIDQTEDTSYNYKGGEYYYDQFDESSFSGFLGNNDPIVAGNNYIVSVISESSLDPLLFLLDGDTNEVLEHSTTYFDSEGAQEITFADGTYNQITLGFTAQADINYNFSVESVLPEQTGDYYITVLDV